MSYQEREDRTRNTSITFWLTKEEKSIVDARILLSGKEKGEYYRAAIIGQELKIVVGRYRSDRLAKVLEDMFSEMKESNFQECIEMKNTLEEMLRLMRLERISIADEEINK